MVAVDLSGRRFESSKLSRTRRSRRASPMDARLANVQRRLPHELWPRSSSKAPSSKALPWRDIDDFEEFVTRLDIMRLLSLREADGPWLVPRRTGAIFPHQLYVAARAGASDPGAVLLADEVGLGKTIEGGVDLNRLVHAGKIDAASSSRRTPDSAWRRDLRKYNQVSRPRCAASRRTWRADFAPRINHFDVHRRAIIALEFTGGAAQLTTRTVKRASFLVTRRNGAAGPCATTVSPAGVRSRRFRRPGRSRLLLSGPNEDDARVRPSLQLLRPEEFPRK